MKENMAFKHILKTLHTVHENVLQRVDAVHHLLNYPRISHEENIRLISEHIDFLKSEITPHIEMTEAVIFPVLCGHVPSLQPILASLKGGHNEFRANVRSFEAILFKARDSSTKREDMIECIKMRGIYLIGLIRSYLRFEKETLYESGIGQLTMNRKKDLVRNARAYTRLQRDREMINDLSTGREFSLI